MNIRRANSNDVVLFWTTDAAAFRLESAANRPVAKTWSNVNSPRVTVGNQIYVTNAIAVPGRFYRLNYP